MARTIFIYGLTAGIATLLLVGFGVAVLDISGGSAGWLWTFTSSLIGLSLVLVGVQRHVLIRRGLSFAGAFGLTFATCLFAALIYTAGWEGYALITGHNVADDYVARALATKVTEGADAAELALAQSSANTFRAQQASTATRIGLTLGALLPAALIMSLIAGLLFRTRYDAEAMD